MTEALRIIIVEDNALIAMDLEELLVGMGHAVAAIACTEAEAVDAAARFRPDLMIVDGTLDEGSGVSAMKQVLQRGFVPHFYITGDLVRIRNQEPEAIIVAKPFNYRDLRAGIKGACPMA